VPFRIEKCSTLYRIPLVGGLKAAGLNANPRHAV
jgi:hypothetical protein